MNELIQARVNAPIETLLLEARELVHTPVPVAGDPLSYIGALTVEMFVGHSPEDEERALLYVQALKETLRATRGSTVTNWRFEMVWADSRERLIALIVALIVRQQELSPQKVLA